MSSALNIWIPIQGSVTTLGDHLTKFVDGYVDEMAADFVKEYPTSHVARLQENTNQIILEKRNCGREWTITNIAIDCLRFLTYFTIAIPLVMISMKIALRTTRDYTVLDLKEKQPLSKENLEELPDESADHPQFKKIKINKIRSWALQVAIFHQEELPSGLQETAL